MEAAAGLVKLKPDTKASVEDWCNTMKTRRDEALQTLRDEGVVVESWFQVEIEGAPYLLWYMRADSIERVWEIAAKSDHEIDAYHFEIMAEVTQSQISAIPILDLSTEPTGS